ncbi:MAG TPA: POTRA domain-containing protein [Pirellulaceae bacterium]
MPDRFRLAAVLRKRQFFWLVCGPLLVSASAQGQFGGDSPLSPSKFGNFQNDPKPRRVPHYEPTGTQPLVEVAVTGQKLVEESRIRAMLQTRVGRNHDPEMVQQDVRALVKSGLFHNVRTYRKEVPGGVSITFEVFERPLVQHIRYVGNQKKKEKHLNKQVGMKIGDPLNRFAVEEARRRLQQFYIESGFSEAQVTILEGHRPQDQGVVFQIVEGQRQRIWSTKFEGNTIASDARLRTQIQAKPGFRKLFGGNVVTDQIDQDLDRVTAYYRSLGFFRAQVTHRLEWNQERTWLTVVYAIQEGPRYTIRDIRFAGNEIFDTPRLASQTTTRAGEYFNLSKLQQDLTAIRDQYGGYGYIFADIDAEPRFLEEPGQLDIVYRISEGEQYRVGRVIVKIDGEENHTRHSVVLNRLSVRPGDIIDLREIRASERRLMASQLFLNDPAQGLIPSIEVKPPAETALARDPGPGGAPTTRGQSGPYYARRPALADVEIDYRRQPAPRSHP